jgi:hypothetical protein
MLKYGDPVRVIFKTEDKDPSIEIVLDTYIVAVFRSFDAGAGEYLLIAPNQPPRFEEVGRYDNMIANIKENMSAGDIFDAPRNEVDLQLCKNDTLCFWVSDGMSVVLGNLVGRWGVPGFEQDVDIEEFCRVP